MVRRRQNRYGGAKPEIWYHGTSVKHLRSILATGLHGKRKSRYTGEMEAFGGVYLTNDIGTAWSFANDFVDATPVPSALIVVTQMQPRSLILDEDFFIEYLNNSAIPRPLRVYTPEALRTYLMIQEGEIDSTIGKHWDEYVREVVKHASFYVRNNTVGFQKRLHQLAEMAFPIGLQYYITRKLSTGEWEYVDVIRAVEKFYGKGQIEDLWKQQGGDYQISTFIPTFQQQMPQYRKMVDSFTKLLRSYVSKFEKARYLGDIGYRGKNRIIGVFSYRMNREPSEKPRSGQGVVLTIHYGEIPEKALRWFNRYYNNKVVLEYA